MKKADKKYNDAVLKQRKELARSKREMGEEICRIKFEFGLTRKQCLKKFGVTPNFWANITRPDVLGYAKLVAVSSNMKLYEKEHKKKRKW